MLQHQEWNPCMRITTIQWYRGATTRATGAKKSPRVIGGRNLNEPYYRCLPLSRSLRLRSASLKITRLSFMKSMAPSNAKIAIVTYIIFTSACSKDNGLLLSRLTQRRTSKLLKLISNMGSKRSDFAPVIPF